MRMKKLNALLNEIKQRMNESFKPVYEMYMNNMAKLNTEFMFDMFECSNLCGMEKTNGSPYTDKKLEIDLEFCVEQVTNKYIANAFPINSYDYRTCVTFINILAKNRNVINKYMEA